MENLKQNARREIEKLFSDPVAESFVKLSIEVKECWSNGAVSMCI
jgi:hypothetical protein